MTTADRPSTDRPSTWLLQFPTAVDTAALGPDAALHEGVEGTRGLLAMTRSAPAPALLPHAEAWYRCSMVADSGPVERTTSHLVVVAFPVPDEALERFDDWYETEHAPLLLGAEDWLRVRRFRIEASSGSPLTCVAVHDLASLDAMDSPNRQEAARGPKRAAMAAEPWYSRSGRWTYRVSDAASV